MDLETWDQTSAQTTKGRPPHSVCVVCVCSKQKPEKLQIRHFKRRRPLRSLVEFAPSTDFDRVDPGGNREQVSPVELAGLIKAS